VNSILLATTAAQIGKMKRRREEEEEEEDNSIDDGDDNASLTHDVDDGKNAEDQSGIEMTSTTTNQKKRGRRKYASSKSLLRKTLTQNSKSGACCAGLALATDSATTVISSMIHLPLMGPVIGMSYGFIIWDVSLIKKSARNDWCRS